MLSIIHRETAVRLKADTTYETGSDQAAYVASGFSRTLEIEEATVLPIIVIEQHLASRQRMPRTAMAIVAIAVASTGLFMWRRAAFDAVPAFPSPPPLFATVPAFGAWAPAAAAAAAPLEVADSYHINVASLRAESSALTLAAGLETAGFPSVTRRRGSGWDVIVGPYRSEAQTVGVRERLALYGQEPRDVFVEAGTPGAEAANARAVRVTLLRSGDRMTLAIEMTAEPQKAVLRKLSPTVLEVETGPVAAPVRGLQLAPSAAGVPAITHVSIREYRARNRPSFVRARMTLGQPARGNIRVVGRVVYVDLIGPT